MCVCVCVSTSRFYFWKQNRREMIQTKSVLFISRLITGIHWIEINKKKKPIFDTVSAYENMRKIQLRAQIFRKSFLIIIWYYVFFLSISFFIFPLTNATHPFKTLFIFISIYFQLTASLLSFVFSKKSVRMNLLSFSW